MRSEPWDAEQDAWNRVRDQLGHEAIPADPDDLEREDLPAIAAHLSGCGWSYREIAATLGVGKSTIGRWLAAEVPAEPQSGGLGLVGLLLGAGAVAAILKATLGKDPRSTPEWANKPHPTREGIAIRGPQPNPQDEAGEAP